MAEIYGTADNDLLQGTSDDDTIFSGGTSSTQNNNQRNYESVSGNGGSDTLVLSKEDEFVGRNNHARIIVQDFIVGDITVNSKADTLNIGAFLEGKNLDANNIGDYLHIESNWFSSSIYVSKEGGFSEQESVDEADSDIWSWLFGGANAVPENTDLQIEFQNWAFFETGSFTNTNFAEITGEADNTVEQFQKLIDIGFLDLSGSFSDNDQANTDIVGTPLADILEGTEFSEKIFSGGTSSGVESITTHGGQDRLILDADDSFVANTATAVDGYLRVNDFIIGDIYTNPEADILDLGNFLKGSNLDASNIGNYLHVVSGTWGLTRTTIFVDREGGFTLNDKTQLTNHVFDGGHGADLQIEFIDKSGSNNNLETITGFSDNSVEQFQALIDMGFLDLSNASSAFVTENVENTLDAADKIAIRGSQGTDILKGSISDDLIYTEGTQFGEDSVFSNGGSDMLVFEADDAHADGAADIYNALIRVNDFIIDDINNNGEADILSLGDFLVGDVDINNIGQYLHVVSGAWGLDRTSIFVDREGNFTADEKKQLSNNVLEGGHGADLYIELMGKGGSSNNFETITGFADNSVEQIQSLIDMGFLDIA